MPLGSPHRLEAMSIGNTVDCAGFCDETTMAVDCVRNRVSDLFGPENISKASVNGDHVVDAPRPFIRRAQQRGDRRMDNCRKLLMLRKFPGDSVSFSHNGPDSN